MGLRTPPKFPPHSPLLDALRGGVDAYFETTGAVRQGGGRIWLKTGVVLLWVVASYLALVFISHTWWQVLLSATSLALAVAGVGFNIQHDANHGAFASRRWWNRLTAWSLDLVGGSSYVWRFKHNVLHHQFTNVDGVDDDLEAGPWLRLCPDQPRYWWHRFQHLYMWPLYVFLPLKWQWFDDFYCLITGRLGRQAVPRPGPGALAGMLAGKALFFGWALVLPLILHPILPVILVYTFICLLMGVVLGTVFQLAHCVEEAEFEAIPAGGARLPRPWAEHQLATTVDFSPRNRLLTWYLGGLNFQVEHHLFPRISHVHYPALEAVVRRVCDEYGVEHLSHRSVWKALRSHIRHIRRMGERG